MNKKLILLTVLMFMIASCGSDATSGSLETDRVDELTLMTHDSFAISEELLAEFESEYGAKMILLPAGDTGAALNQAILSQDNPLADLFFGVDNAFLGRALAEEIFEPYQSPLLESIPDKLELDDSYHLLPVDYGDVCLNYDKKWFAQNLQSPPRSLSDLAEAEYENLLVVENPATSSPGLAFLLATIDEFGTEGSYTYVDYWQALRENGVLVTDGWEDAYFGHFSATSSGDRPLVVSYASSPPAEVVFADPPINEPPTASVTSPGTCFRQIEFVGILKGTENRDLAERFVDFMLSKDFQEDIPLNMFVFPANQDAALPDVFVQWAALTEEPASIAPAEIDANREDWIEVWTDVVLR